MFWVMPIADPKAYVLPEILGYLRLLPLHCHFHFVLDNAPQSAVLWEAWRDTLPPHLTATMEEAEGGPEIPHGYNMRNCAWVMTLDEKLRQAFLATDEQWCFWQECDQIVLPCHAKRLMRRDVDIVMAATPARRIPCALNAFDKKDRSFNILRQPVKAGELVEVNAVGLGCTLMKRRVLETVGWENPERLTDVYHNGGDYTICRQYREATEISPFVDTAVKVDHVDGNRGTIRRFRIVEKRGNLSPLEV